MSNQGLELLIFNYRIVMGHLTVMHVLTFFGFFTLLPELDTRSHVYRALNQTAYETFEVSGPLMVLVMKLTTFAWNVHDGRRPIEVRGLSSRKLES